MENKILVETSARHIHLSEEHINILFGEGHQLTVKKMLSQPGQFACEEKVTVKGAKGERMAEMTGRELEDDGFEAVLPERCDGELYEIRIR